MEKKEYRLMRELEDSFWFFKGKKKILETLVRTLAGDKAGKRKILDIGCGVGSMLSALSGSGEVYGTDSSPEAVRFCSGRGFKEVSLSSGEKLPFSDDFFEIVCFFDVLEHVEDEKAFLKETARVAKKDALIFMTVPAYQFLWSGHDEALHHKRRYTLGTAKKAVLDNISAETIRETYFNTFLFPAAAFHRMLQKILGKSGGSDMSLEFNPVLNRIFYRIFSFESKILPVFNFPFGLSVFLCFRLKK